MSEFKCDQFDLSSSLIFPTDWDHQILKLAEESGIRTWLDGKSSTSRESANAEGCSVIVVTGEIICEKLPWLDKAYREALLDLAVSVSGLDIVPAHDSRIAVNINLLKGIKARYEWHVDSNPLTGILYTTDHDESTGGEIVFENSTVREAIWPKKGLFIVFNAQETPHTVMPLKKNITRISIPMNYFIAGQPQARPSDLDQYIYSKAEVENGKN